jgi:DNA (cytosine-5)-methyltransferase 1
MTPIRVLDLFCGAGGAAVGLHRAWPDADILGVDIVPQPRYPFRFAQADAMTFPLEGYDFIWASPPCQDHVRSPGPARKHGTGWMLKNTRQRLMAIQCIEFTPWAIENVPGAPLRADYILLGHMFGLKRLRRERWFETSWRGFQLMPVSFNDGPVISVTGTGTPTGTWKKYGSLKLADFNAAMGIDWMKRAELSQAIPPAYSEFIARQFTS